MTYRLSLSAALTLLCPVFAAPEAEAKKTPEAPAGQVLLLTLRAEGVQIYKCRPKKDKPSEFEWSFEGPEAVLRDDTGKPVGKHYGGPTWEAIDKSKIVAAMPPVTVTAKAGAIPELLLKTKTTEGKGVFSAVTFVRRVDTVGGVAPEAPDAKQAGKEVRVPYKATYLFYGPKP
jgi:hypothetical protein